MADEQQDYYEGKGVGPYWHAQLEHTEKVFSTWIQRGEKVVKRYRDERDAVDRLRSKFNILWSNIQVLTPSLYGRPAQPQVSRRFRDSDPVARVASTMLERVLEYEVTQFPDFDEAMCNAVADRLLPGRGTVWARYEPVIVQETMTAPEGMQVTSTTDTGEETPITMERIQEAHAPVDYVYWKDFRHSVARTWDEVWWVGRRAYLTQDEGIKRFGNQFKDVPLTAYKEDNSNQQKDKTQANNNFSQKAAVWEIWDKRTKKVCWVAEGYTPALDEKDDFLNLEQFFPCPKPLYATMTAGSLVPVPDYCEYEDQARELDTITGRIGFLIKAIKAVGVFNGEFKELSRLLTEGEDNKLFPVSNWAGLAEKGGLKGAVELLDITIMQQTLGTLYTNREQLKEIIYEICGISDIIRGSSSAEETLGAQQLKAQFGSMRLRVPQLEVARFAADIFRLKAQIISKFYPGELIAQISDIATTPDGQNPQLVQQALQMLQNASIRDWHINVSSDTLAQIDEEREKSNAVEMLTAVSGFMKGALETLQAAPEFLPMAAETLKFIMRQFKAGKVLEASVEQSLQALQQRIMQQMQNPQPSKEQIEMQMQAQADQVRAQADMQAAQFKTQLDAQVQSHKAQSDAQLEVLKAHLSSRDSQMQAMLKQVEGNMDRKFEQWKTVFEGAKDIKIANIQAEAAKQKPEPVGKE